MVAMNIIINNKKFGVFRSYNVYTFQEVMNPKSLTDFPEITSESQK